MSETSSLSKTTSELDLSDESNDFINLSDASLEGLEAFGVNKQDLIIEEEKLKKKSKLEELQLLKKMKEEQNIKAKKEKAVKSMKDLLAISTKYSNFFYKKLNNECNNNKANGSSNIKENGSSTEMSAKLKFKNPKYFTGGILKPYQEEGLLWLINLYKNGINGILADEMGLGKTIQVIALICYLVEKKVPGPYLIIAPLSTLPNWMMEFKRFAPKIPLVLFHGSQKVRIDKYPEILKTDYKVDDIKMAPVVITSYQIPMTELKFLQRFNWQYIIIDEGHRIKNHECRLLSDLKSLKSLNRLLLTGTPLQNNLLELWSLLNYLLPQLFKDADTFDALFMIDEFQKSENPLKQKENINIITTIHGVLGPFMLRRLKSDVLIDLVPKKEVLVYCPLTQFQRDLYKLALQNDYQKLYGFKKKSQEILNLDGPRPKRRCTRNTKNVNLSNGTDNISTNTLPDENEDLRYEFQTNILKRLPVYDLKLQDCNSFLVQMNGTNSVITYKRIVNHPYLIYYPLKPGCFEFLVDEKIVEYSGKMKMLDILLPKLKERGHKVLLFSTLKILLDIVEDYLGLRNYEYCRLDGDCNLENRQASIKEFNENPNKFIFLISNRAGGLGLNLTAADTVIFYDRDWNPQSDIQAQDRCHRIGQTKPVIVYSFITKGTIDERILDRSTAKKKLEKAVIHKGSFKSFSNFTTNIADIVELQKLLEIEDANLVVQPNGTGLSDEEIEKLLDRSDICDVKNKEE